MANTEIKKGRWATKRANKKKKAEKKESYRKTGRLRLQSMLEAGLEQSDQKTKLKLIQRIKFILNQHLSRIKTSFAILLTGWK